MAEFEIKNKNLINRSNQFFFLNIVVWECWINCFISSLYKLAHHISLILLIFRFVDNHLFLALPDILSKAHLTELFFWPLCLKVTEPNAQLSAAQTRLDFKLSLSIRPTTCLTWARLVGVSGDPVGWEVVVSALRMPIFRETKPAPSLYQEGKSFLINLQPAIPQVTPGL